MLGLAQDLGAPFVDVELKAAPAFPASRGVFALRVWRCQHGILTNIAITHGPPMVLCCPVECRHVCQC